MKSPEKGSGIAGTPREPDTGDSITYLGATNRSQPFLTTSVTRFLIKNVKKVSDVNLDDNEDIRVVLKSLAGILT